MKTIKDVLQGENFRQWEDARRDRQALEALIGETLAASDTPPECCSVGGMHNEELRLCAVSAAAAARIRQILPTLQRILNSRGYAVRIIHVRIERNPAAHGEPRRER